MKSLKAVLVAQCVGLALLGCAQMAGRDGGLVTLIDGSKGLENWNPVGDANWRAEGGAIVADAGKGGYLVSKNSYKDFELHAEFWAEDTTNSGIFMRCANPSAITDRTCYEANIYDQRGDPSFGTGAITHIAKVSPMPRAGGKWNTYEITAKGSHLVLVLNGVKTVDIRHTQLTEGPIALQYNVRTPKGDPGGAIKWRKVQIRPL